MYTIARSAASAVALRSAMCSLHGPSLRRLTLSESAVGRAAWGSSPRLARAFAGSPEPTEAALAACKSNAQYEAGIAEAETRSAIAKASASKATVEASKATWLFRAAIGTVLALALDYIWHDTKSAIKWNMKRKLLACERPPTVPALPKPAARLATDQPTPQLTFLPTALLGPTGCGKSTVLRDLARAFILADTPTLLIGIRMPSEDSSKRPLTIGEAKKLMDATARQVCSLVGFPARRSIIGPLLDLVVDLVAAAKATPKAEADSTGAVQASAEGSAMLVPSGSRLMTCFTCLFEVAAQVARNRQAAGMTELEAAPVLLLDGLEDFIKDDRIKNAGGQILLNHLACLMINASVDTRTVRVCFTGSSAKLLFALPSLARGFRLQYEYQADPTRESLLQALTSHKYSAEDAARMVNLCGTRLHLFDSPLHKDPPPPAATFMSTVTMSAKGDFRGVEGSLAAADKARFAAMLDRVEASYSGGLTVLDSRATMPPSAVLIDLAPILFVDHTHTLTFQSDLHRKVWQTERKRPEWR
jgi:hypothetical protein